MRTVLHVFPSFVLGGSQSRFLKMLERWPADIAHRVLPIDGRLDAASLASPIGRLEQVAFVAVKGRGFANRAKLRNLLAAISPDCLVTYNWGAIEAVYANLPRLARHVHVEDGFGPEEASRRLPRRSWARAVGLRLAGAELLVPSLTLQSIALTEWHINPRRVHLVPNGVRVPAQGIVEDNSSICNPRWADGRTVIGVVGALRPEKRVDRFLEALASLPDCVALIAGDGPERDELERATLRFGLTERVQFLGQIDDPARVYRVIDLLALTSDTEQLPMSVLEAMAHCLPVVATQVGDVAHCVAVENRPFVVARDVKAIAAAIQCLALDDKLRVSVGRSNLLRVQEAYGFESMCNRWLELMLGH
jgi:glycosyltransferase involved in cell wall biosynthesis